MFPIAGFLHAGLLILPLGYKSPAVVAVFGVEPGFSPVLQ